MAIHPRIAQWLGALVSCTFAGVWVAMSSFAAAPPAWTVVAFALVSVLALALSWQVWSDNYIAFDRLTQLVLILVFSPLTAALVAIPAYFVWTVLSGAITRTPWHDVLAHAFYTAGTAALAVLAGGAVFQWAGGHSAPWTLDASLIGAFIVLAVSMQAAHMLARLYRAWAWQKRYRVVVLPVTNMVELSMLALAVLVAWFYSALPAVGFVLLVLLQLLLGFVLQKFHQESRNIDRHTRQMTAIHQITKAVSASAPIATLAWETYQQCSESVRFNEFLVAVNDDVNKGRLKVILHQCRGRRVGAEPLQANQGLISWVAQHNEPLLVENWARDRRVELKRHGTVTLETPQCWLGVPLSYHGRFLGAICLQNSAARTLGPADRAFMQTLAAQLGAALANASLFGELEEYRRELEDKVAERTESLRRANEAKNRLLSELQRKTEALDRLSKEDALTGLYNRRYMDERLVEEFARAQRFDCPISLAMMDLDHFKIVNDRFSHSVGDEVLRAVAQVLRNNCRTIDIIARYGGEELLVCFPETDVEGAVVVCERVRRALHDYAWSSIQPGLSTVTISMGIAGGTDYRRVELQKAADRHLYQAKDEGRDRICT